MGTESLGGEAPPLVRNVAGPADPAVVRAKLAEEARSAKMEAMARIAAQRAPAVGQMGGAPPPAAAAPVGGLLGAAMGALQNRPQVVEGAVNGRQ